MYTNPLAGLGFGTPDPVNGGRRVDYRVSLDYQTLLNNWRGSWIVRAVVEAVPEDMLKSFPNLSCDLTPEEISKFDRVVDKTLTLDRLLEGLKWGRLFGGALAVIILAGESQKDLSKPLKLEDVGLNSYRGMIVLDRWSGVSPSGELNDDISDPDCYGLPKWYDVTTETSQNFTVHHTRCLRFVGRSLPLFEKQIQTYWGLSEVEAIYEDLQRRDYSAAAIANLIARANVMVIKEPMLAQMLSGVGLTQQQLQDHLMRVQAVSQSIGTNGLLTLGQDAEFFNSTYSFGGLSEVYQSFMLDVSGACGIPVSRLYGRTITGLGQSGEGDLQVYYDNIDVRRKRELRPILDKLISIICMSTFGEVPDDLDFTFPSIRSVTDDERASLADKTTKSIIDAYNADLLTKKEARSEMKQQADIIGLFTNITDEAVAATPDCYASEMGGGELNQDGDGGSEEQPGKPEQEPKD